MKVRHITKRKMCAWQTMRGVTSWVLREQTKHGRPLTASQKTRLRWRNLWK